MTTSFARVRTNHAEDYLCFLVLVSTRNATSASDGNRHAVIQLPRGVCEITADDRCLDISITANSISDAVTLEDVISERLDDVAGGEELHYQWIMAPSRKTSA